MMGGIGFMSIFWVGIIILVVALIWPRVRKEESQRNSETSLLEILKKRYARGEIGKEEYAEKKSDLVSLE